MSKKNKINGVYLFLISLVTLDRVFYSAMTG